MRTSSDMGKGESSKKTGWWAKATGEDTTGGERVREKVVGIGTACDFLLASPATLLVGSRQRKPQMVTTWLGNTATVVSASTLPTA